jgi:hypothetical protein
MKFTSALILSCLYSITLAQVFPWYLLISLTTNSTQLCLYSEPSGDNDLRITITAPATYGWAAIGFGKSMSKAEIYVVSLNNGISQSV